jgi:hypothetical protein
MNDKIWEYMNALNCGDTYIAENEQLFRIYPNPSNGKFQIHTNQNQGVIKIMNVFGRLMYEEKLEVQTSSIDIDVAKGIYFVRMESEGVALTKRIVVY